MSGLKAKQSFEGGKYLNFKDGDIVTKVNDETQIYGSVEGRVVNLDIQDAEYEGKPYKKIILFIEFDNTVKELGFALESGYGNAFARLAPNVDWNKEVEISAKVDVKQGKKYASMFIKQDGKNLKWFWTNDYPKNLPDAETETLRNGTVMKYYDKRNEFLLNYIMTDCRADILKSVGKEPVTKENVKAEKQKDKAADSKASKSKLEPDAQATVNDDLPF